MNKHIVLITLLSLSFSSIAGTLLYPDTQKSAVHFQSLNDLKGLGVDVDASQFVLKTTQEGLLGKYLTFQKVVNGRSVENSEIVVSLDQNGQVMKVYHDLSASNEKMVAATVPMISQDMALETVWKKLNVNGRLINKPEVALFYQKDMTLVYRVRLSVSSPVGHFEAIVNAQNGNVVSVKDAALPRAKRTQAMVRLSNKAIFSSYSAALNAFEVAQQKSFGKLFTTTNGTAQVFDPNPTVTLGRSDLQDDTDASVFLPAYKTEDLKEISSQGGVYHLAGTKVALKDFESPNVEPTTSPDGHWIYERGNAGFTDAMAYLHIDRSIRYIESLGFKGNHVIFNHVLEVDSDGLYGDDNSHYIPYTKQLAFGHGCVDDDEDAEVILHELGHAIQDHINPSWGGGDTGAMGEGFGDYWAASYTATTDRGMEGNVNWVFKFDGHNDCWPGRKLDSYTPKYNASTTYQAHAQVNGGVSDELWSTPIFQAFLEMYKSGVAKADIDRIILEAHFGLGSGLKMPDMAKSIVKTAKALYPKANYDQIYLKHFKKVGIL